MKIGFDNELYIKTQSEHIRERMSKFGGKLYLEFGGKLFDDFHASRVLPGFRPDTKISMLKELSGQTEAIVAINANDIERSKVRGDLGITYDLEAMRIIDSFQEYGISVCGIVLTMYGGQRAAKVFENRLKERGLNVYHHYPIEGYPADVKQIVSENGFGKNDFVKTNRPLVIVSAPGPGSGKMAVCLSQMYHENRKGVKAGYAKFETFPIWNLPLTHPVNVAYEAATADLNDKNIIDPFHMDAYGVAAVNYNRDVEVFPVLNAMLQQIMEKSPYNSPTDMGVNMAGKCIVDDAAVQKAACDEVIRRHLNAQREKTQGNVPDALVTKIGMLMKQLNLKDTDRKVVSAVREKSRKVNVPVAAMELENGKVVTGKAGKLLGASPALILNALKELAGIPDSVKLIDPDFIEPVQKMKVTLGDRTSTLTIDEILIALSIYANKDDNAAKALAQIRNIRGCEVHLSIIPNSVNEAAYRRLGVNLTCEPKYQTACMYQH